MNLDRRDEAETGDPEETEAPDELSFDSLPEAADSRLSCDIELSLDEERGLDLVEEDDHGEHEA